MNNNKTTAKVTPKANIIGSTETECDAKKHKLQKLMLEMAEDKESYWQDDDSLFEEMDRQSMDRINGFQ